MLYETTADREHDSYKLVHPHATRSTMAQAKRAFLGGGSVIVTERPEGDTKFVYPTTTIHSLETGTWDALADMVRMWRNRYPRQTFYIVSR